MRQEKVTDNELIKYKELCDLIVQLFLIFVFILRLVQTDYYKDLHRSRF